MAAGRQSQDNQCSERTMGSTDDKNCVEQLQKVKHRQASNQVRSTRTQQKKHSGEESIDSFQARN
jgi:hypothetical protein